MQSQVKDKFENTQARFTETKTVGDKMLLWTKY